MTKVKSDDAHDRRANVVFKPAFCHVYNIVKSKLVPDLLNKIVFLTPRINGFNTLSNLPKKKIVLAFPCHAF